MVAIDTSLAGAKASELPAPETLGRALLGAAMAVLAVAPLCAHAESAPERGQIAMKYLDYLDSQPGDPRIQIYASQFMVMAPLSSDWSITGTWTADGISGASPANQSSNLSRLTDRRNAVDASATRYLPNGSVTVGASISSEADYVSRGISVQATQSDDSKNTTWSYGLGYNKDDINPSNQIVTNEGKEVTSLLLGVTQVVTTHDIVQFNAGLSSGQGYFSDPYKFADERPRTKDSTTWLARWNHHFEQTQSTTRLSYRYYADSWGIRAHTLGVELVQRLPDGWTLTPAFRLYSQSAANFYADANSSSFPFAPDTSGAYSEDQRLAAFGAHTWGLKLSKQINADWQADVKYEAYAQRAEWKLFGSGSPGLSPFDARSIQIGVSRQF